MAHNPFTGLLKTLFVSALQDDKNLSASYNQWQQSRRNFLKNSALATAGMALLPSFTKANKSAANGTQKIVIVGAGMAGLNAAYQFKKHGITTAVYEAATRTGGRMFTLNGRFDEHSTTDMGGEFIDTSHTEIFDLAKELQVDFYDLRLDKAEPKAFYFDGRHLTQADLREALKPFVTQVVKDLQSLPPIIDYNSADQFQHLDNLSITEYIKSIGITGWLYNFINVCLTREYGMEASEQSAINFLIMFDAPVDADADYELFGQSHEVFKIKGGSQHLTNQLYRQVKNQVSLQHKLTAITTGKAGGYDLTFDNNGASKIITADYVLVTLPYSVLRNIKMDIPMPAEKRKCINELSYGNSCKFMIGFNGRPWRNINKQGYTFNDLAFGCGWDNTQMQTTQQAGFTVFGGGNIANEIAEGNQAALSKKFVPALDTVYPGAAKLFNGKNAKFCWQTNPFSNGGYCSFKKGEWSKSGWEAVPVDTIFFAGEHVSREFQGYMNGAAQSARIAVELMVKKMYLGVEDQLKNKQPV